VLALETLFYAEDVRASNEIKGSVEATEVKPVELDLARQVIASLAGEFEPEEFENEYRRELRAMLDAKVAGEAITAPEPAAEAPIADLLEALKQSVAAAKKTGDEPAKPARSRARAAARKSG
jgi:DNA end-binding protein Ku